MRRPRFSPVMLSALLCLLLTHASNQAFGVEILSVTCGPASPGGHLACDVTVKVSMLSGSPDYVDITYSAVDFNGVSLTCNPASDLHELVSRTHSFTDHIQVTATTGTVFPVEFTAYATGEAAGGDNESGSISLSSSNFGSFAGPKAATEIRVQVTPVGKSIRQLVPISITAMISNKLETLTLGYGANYTCNSLASSLLSQNAVSVMAPLVARRNALVDVNSVPPMGQPRLVECANRLPIRSGLTKTNDGRPAHVHHQSLLVAPCAKLPERLMDSSLAGLISRRPPAWSGSVPVRIATS